MEDWRPVMALGAVEDGALNKAETAGIKLVVVKNGDDVFVYEDACPHEGYALSEGMIEDDILICAKHLWEFELRTGLYVSRLPRPETNLNGFPVRIVGSEVQINLAAPTRPAGISAPVRPTL